MRRRAATVRGFQLQVEIDSTFMIDDRLGRLDHHFHLQRSAGESILLLQQIEDVDECRDLFRRSDLWQCHYKVAGQLPVGCLHNRRNENVERAHAARAQFFIEGLDADTDEGR